MNIKTNSKLIDFVNKNLGDLNREKKDSAIMSFLKSSVNKLNTIIASLDKILKTIDIEAAYNAVNKKKTTIKSFFTKKTLIPSESSIEDRRGIFESLKSKATDIFKKSPEEATAPPSSRKISTFLSNSNLIENISEKIEAIANGDKEEDSPGSLKERKQKKIDTLINRKKSSFKNRFNSDPEAKKRTPFEKLKARMNKRKEEIAKEKEAIKKGKEKEKGNFLTRMLGKIVSGISSITGAIFKSIFPMVAGISKVMFKSLGWMTGKLLKGIGLISGKAIKGIVKGIGGILTKVIPGLSGGIAKGTSKAVKSGIKGLFSVGKKVLGAGVRMIPGLVRGAASIAVRGVAALASGPAAAVIAAGTVAYGGYKLYKYLTRNSIDDDIYGKLTLLRLYAYGFNDVKKEHYHKVFDLEMLHKDFILYKNETITFKKLDQSTLDKIYDIFDVDVENKDQVKVFNTWYLKRFLPAFSSFLTPLYAANDKIFIDDLDILKNQQLYTYVTSIQIPNTIYEIKLTPTFDDPTVYVTKDEISMLLTNIINKVKGESKEKGIDINKLQKENSSHVSKAKVDQEQVDAIIQKQRANLSKLTSTKPIDINKMPLDPSDEGENELKKPDPEKIQSSKASKINIAGGDLYPGGTNLEGITTRLPKSKIFGLDPNIRELFTGMAKEYYALTGKSIPVTQAYRSSADQRRLYRQNPRKAAPPGRSLHEFGLAIDIDSKAANKLDDLGLMKKYGFTRPVSGEHWHVEPIGISLRPTYFRDNPSARFEAIQASIGRGGGGYAIESKKGRMRRPARNIKYQKKIFDSKPSKTIEESVKPLDTMANKANIVQVKEDTKPVDTLKPVKVKTTKDITPKLTAANTEDYEAKPKTTGSTSTKPKDSLDVKLNKQLPTSKTTAAKKDPIQVNKYKAMNVVTPTATKPQKTDQAINNIQLDTSNLESVMHDQLSTLSNIASILTSIDGKIDLSKLANLIPKQPTQQNSYMKDISASRDSVDLKTSKIN
jgi:hypothetical protein